LQTNANAVTQTTGGTSTVIEQFTEQVNLRVRGRSLALRLSSSDIGVTWRLGSPRIDIKPDGRR